MKALKYLSASLALITVVLGVSLTDAAWSRPVRAPATGQSPFDVGIVQLVQYELPAGMIHNTTRPEGNPSQVHGVLALPRGTARHLPVALILHGTHGTCVTRPRTSEAVLAAWQPLCGQQRYQRNDDGLSYLAQGLARRGFVALAIDVSAATGWWNGEVTSDRGYTQLMRLHLQLLRDFNAGKTHGLRLPPTRGRIDTSRLLLVGHSTGGGEVLSKSAQLPGVIGVVAIEPASPTRDRQARLTVPVMTIRGTCDEQVGVSDGLGSERDLVGWKSTGTVIDVLLKGVGHAVLNTAEGAQYDDYVCTRRMAAEPAASRNEVARLVGSFARQTLVGVSRYSLPDVGHLVSHARNLVPGSPSVRIRDVRRSSYLNPRGIVSTRSSQPVLPPVPPGQYGMGDDF